MIPSFLTNDLANEILQTGKAVNFIRRCCKQDWSLQMSFKVDEWVSDQSNFEVLRHWVDQATEETNRTLMDMILGKFQFLEHCDAVRRYLLLG